MGIGDELKEIDGYVVAPDLFTRSVVLKAPDGAMVSRMSDWDFRRDPEASAKVFEAHARAHAKITRRVGQ